MYEKLFVSEGTLVRHQSAPFFEERKQYLQHCAEEGYSQSTLLRIARGLFWIARRFQAKLSSHQDITPEEIEKAANQWARQQCRCGRAKTYKWPRESFMQQANRWFRFLGCLQAPISNPMPFTTLIDDFATFMQHERGLSPVTIQNRCWHVEQFLTWYQPYGGSISSIQVTDVDMFLTRKKHLSRVTIATTAKALRAFFRHAKMRGWCNSLIPDSIQGPRLFCQETLPSGPSWEDIRRLLDSMETSRPCDIRDRAIIMLFAIYGLRVSEVATLSLDDIKWEHNQITIKRRKQRRSETYPLIPIVGNAIIKYLQVVRPQSSHREVFLTLKAPIKPLSGGGLYNVTSTHIAKLGIRTLHRGPHSLRHACAARLVSEGLSLKEIGDHLGHRSNSATRIYAKVDLPKLREVAKFNFGGAL
jgi:integrase/recombinase XerD